MSDDGKRVFLTDRARRPPQFPTHAHDPHFWEELGRAVATFGFLEEVLGKAILVFTGTKPYSKEAIAEAFDKWTPVLEQALYGQLGGLIDLYSKSVREHPGATITNLDDLVGALRDAARLRNVLCHGSWQRPDQQGRSLPFFVNRKKEIFDTPIDIGFLQQTQRHVADLICEVMDTVTHMGWQFPGSSGPGEPVFSRNVD